MKTNKKGISLIVLVVTIIVMIILAAAAVITLVDNGIIGKANEAVEGMNEAQVKEMADLAWAEAYLDPDTPSAQKTADWYKQQVITYLQNNGIDTDKYQIEVTDKGVGKVEFKGGSSNPVGALNEYGFYFDSLYVGTIAENPMGYTNIGFVYHEDGSGEGYVKIPAFGDSLFPILLYDAGQISYSENNINLLVDPDSEAEVSDNGNIISGRFEGLAVTTTYSNQTLHGVYYNKEYSGVAKIDGVDIVIKAIIDNNKNITVTMMTLDGSLVANATQKADVAYDEHVLTIDGTVLGVPGISGDIPCFVSSDGKEMLVGGEAVLSIEPIQTLHKDTIPEGGTYYTGVTPVESQGDYVKSTDVGVYTGATEYKAGDAFPTPTPGDVYVYGDYEYRYNYAYFPADEGAGWINYKMAELIGYDGLVDGWGVKVLNTSKPIYGDILNSINNKSVTNLSTTFMDCTTLVSSPKLPNAITNMYATFWGCGELVAAPSIPTGVVELAKTFEDCKNITAMPALYEGLVDISYAFDGCSSLTEVKTIPSTVTDMWSAFSECTSITTAPDMSKIISLNNVANAFYRCTNLKGTITLNTNPVSYGGFISGTQITAINGSTTLKTELMATK